MGLAMLDLDDTLVDRAAAFRRWAEDFAAAYGGGPAAVDWLVEADRDGYAPRDRLAAQIADRFPGVEAGRVEEDLRAGMVEQLELDPAVVAALARLRAAGWASVVVTNGAADQQERKLRHTGLDRLVDGWVISGAAGVAKPDPRVFALAAARVGRPLAGSVMVGDSARHDVLGGRQAGARTVWIRRGRAWTEPDLRPDHAVDDVPEAVDLILGPALDPALSPPR